MTVYVQSNFLGPLPSKNSVGAQAAGQPPGTANFQCIPITLLNTTAQVWTHNYNATPLFMMPFINSNTNGGTPMPALNTCVMTSNNNAITATPVASVNVLLIVCWSLPAGSQFGAPTTTFA